MISMNQASMKIRNQYAIINAIIQNEQMSRSSLSKKLNLSKPTISTNVDKLLDKGILCERGYGDTAVGKKPIMLSFNSNYRLVMVIDFSQTIPMMHISDLSRRIVAQRRIENVDLIRKSVLEFMEDVNVHVKNIGIIVISMPGIIDDKSCQRLVNPQFRQYDSVKIKADLSEFFNVPVRVENDINLAAIGEQYSGFRGASVNLMYLSLGLGIGAGIVLNSHLYRGSEHAAGEIGYQNVVNFKGDIVQLERYINIPSVVKRYAKKVIRDNYKWITAHGITEVDYEIFIQAVEEKEPVAYELLREITWILGMVVFNMAVVLDLDCIVLGGELSKLNYPLLDDIQAQINAQSEFNVKIESSKLSNACIEGALNVGIEEIVSTLI